MSSGPLAWIRALFLNNVFVPRLRALQIQASFVSEQFEHAKAEALIDSGAMHNFISPSLAKSMSLSLSQMKTPHTI